MAYDRTDRSRWSDRDFDRGRERGFERRDERGFIERAGDEIRSWFGSDEDDHGDRDHRGEHRPRERRFMSDEEGLTFGGERGSDRGDEGWFGSRWSERGEDERFRGVSEPRGRFERDEERGYRPLAGDYGRSGFRRDEERGRMTGGFDRDRDRDRESRSEWGRDEYRRSDFAGSAARSNYEDRHYREERRRHLEEFDRDFDQYRRERQSRFDDDFGSWREQRQGKRQLLGRLREHMEVAGSDGRHVGTVDRVAGDRVILAKSDPDSGGVHHSLSCAELDRIEDDRLILGCTAEEARRRWRDESRERALFEREDQGSSGPHMLGRSFSGTYR